MDTPLAVFENAVAKAMPAGIRRQPALGQQGRRPVVTAVLIAQVQRFATSIVDRVVVLRRNPEFVGVFAPSIGHAGLGYHRAEGSGWR